MITPEHLKAIELITDSVRKNPCCVALILIGSLARGEETDGSDIDCIFVDSRLSLYNDGFGMDIHDFGGPFPVEVSVSSISKEFLEAAVISAPEPQRFAFVKAKVLYTQDPGIEEIVQKIGVYPEWERSEKMKAFYSQLPVHLAYLGLGEYSQNIFLLTKTAQKLAFFSGRLMLAYNKILYPNRKQFMKALYLAPEKPVNFIPTLETLLREPSIVNAEAFMNVVMNFRRWEVPEEGVWTRFCKVVSNIGNLTLKFLLRIVDGGSNPTALMFLVSEVTKGGRISRFFTILK